MLAIIREFKFAGLQRIAFYNEIIAGARNEIEVGQDGAVDPTGR